MRDKKLCDDLKFSSIEDVSASLKFDIPEEEGSVAVKNLIASFRARRNELEQFLQNEFLSKEIKADYKLELKIVKTAIKKFETGK